MDVSFDHLIMVEKNSLNIFLIRFRFEKLQNRNDKGFDPFVRNNSVIIGMGHSKAVSIQQPRCLYVTYLDKGEHSGMEYTQLHLQCPTVNETQFKFPLMRRMDFGHGSLEIYINYTLIMAG